MPFEMNVIKTAHERRNERGSRLSRKQRLIGTEAQRDIHHGAVRPQRLAGLEAVNSERHLDRHVLGDLPEVIAFPDHARKIKGGNFRAHRPFDDLANLGDHFLESAGPILQ